MSSDRWSGLAEGCTDWKEKSLENDRRDFEGGEPRRKYFVEMNYIGNSGGSVND